MAQAVAALLLLLGTQLYAAVRVSGTQFVNSDGSSFSWRGITAFRLVEQVASGREQDARALLDWARDHHITVVRVFIMAKHAFELPPDRGRTALPRLLALAAERHLQVEVVALVDTAAYPIDFGAHVEAVGKACAAAGNCFIEIANEPYHATQADAVHDRGFLRTLRGRVPRDIPVALGAAPEAKDSGGGDYATVHLSRDTGDGGRAYLRAIPAAGALLSTLKVPVVSDEPIGAGPRFEAGRRDTDPQRFREAGRLTREAGLGATFHYTGGIDAKIPSGVERACFDAWLQGITGAPGR